MWEDSVTTDVICSQVLGILQVWLKTMYSLSLLGIIVSVYLMDKSVFFKSVSLQTLAHGSLLLREICLNAPLWLWVVRLFFKFCPSWYILRQYIGIFGCIQMSFVVSDKLFFSFLYSAHSFSLITNVYSFTWYKCELLT